MGKYTEPAIILNKQYETLNKGLANMYGNVAKNAELIRKREATKKQATAKRISEWSKIYGKNTSENYQGALDFTNAQPQDNKNMQAFTDNLKTVYKSGYENIANMVKEGKSETEIAAYVQDQINAANNFTSGIVAFDAFQKEYSNGIQNIGKQAGKMTGRQTGDVVIGSQFGNIFEALSIDPSEQAAIPFDKLKMAGNLEDGVKFFYDNEIEDNKIQDAEVLDFKGLADNYENGKNPYFKKIEDFTEITKQYKAQLDNVEKDPAFLTEYKYTDANGQTQKMTSINKKARQDYFLDSKTPGGKLIEEMLRSKDQTMLVQSVFGYEAANKFDGNDPAQMEALKIGLANKLSPSLFPGAEKLAPSANDRTTVSRSYDDPDPEIEVIENFTKPVHDDVVEFRQTNGDDDSRIKQFVGRPYKAGSGALGAGIISNMTTTKNPPTVQVTYAVNGKTEVSRVFDMTVDADAKEFESSIINGNFPKTKRQRIEGTYDGLLSGERYDDADKSTRITTRKGEKVMSIDRLNEIKQEQGSPLSTDQAYEVIMGDYDVAGASPQANAAVTPAVSASGAGTAGTAGTAGAVVTSATTPATSATGPANFNISNFVVNPSGGIAPAQGASPDATSSIILGIMNDEATIGASGGGGVANFGFTGTTSATSTKGKWLLENAFEPAMNDLKSKYPNLNEKQYQAMAAEQSIEKYIIGKGAPEMGKKADGNTTIMSDLNVSYDEFDKFPADLKRTLIDYKLNSGRSSKDLIAVALGKETGEDAYLDTKVGEVNTLVKGLKYDAATLAKLTPEKLEQARNDMYLGPIKVISETLVSNPSGDAKIGNKTLSYADRVEAADSRWIAWTTSQGKRGGSTGDQGNYGVIAKLTAKPSTSSKAVNFKSVMENNTLPTDQEFKDSYDKAKKGDLLITTNGEVKPKL